MSLALKIVLTQLAGLVAPLVCLVYRKGIWNTPDDPVSPHGMYEPTMTQIYAMLPQWVGDWWWLGVRNRAYGLAYKFKPQHFKDLKSYDDVVASQWTVPTWYGSHRTIMVDGYEEHTYSCRFFHVIVGYRLRPIFDEWYNNRFNAAGIKFRPINMDARPILSVRSGARDD